MWLGVEVLLGDPVDVGLGDGLDLRLVGGEVVGRAGRRGPARRACRRRRRSSRTGCGKPWMIRSLAKASSASVTGRGPVMSVSSLTSSTSASLVTSVWTEPPASNGPGPLAEGEVRAGAVGVALVLAQVQVDPAGELAAQDRVHHRQREVVGRAPRARRPGRRPGPTARPPACRRGRSSPASDDGGSGRLGLGRLAGLPVLERRSPAWR